MKLIVHIPFATAAIGVVSAYTQLQPPVVDNLVSGQYLQKRESGYANGGDVSNDEWTYSLSVYHINDVHAFVPTVPFVDLPHGNPLDSHLDEFRPSGSSCLDPTKGCVAGYSRVKTVIDQILPTRENSLFLNAGDEFQGTLFFALFKGEKISQVLNQLGFDAMTLGNHEFDDGDELLADFLDNLTFPVVSSNIHSGNDRLADNLRPYIVFAEHELVILGLTTETTPTISHPNNVTTFEAPVVAAKRTVKHIKECHPKINRIIALTHIGYEQDIALAKATTGISLIIGGHSHTLLGNMTGSKGPYPTIVKNQEGDDVFVVTSYRWGEYLGYIDVEFDRRGKIVKYEGAPIHLTNSTAEDAGLKAQITEWSKAFIPYQRTVLGYAQKPLIQATCQMAECTLGDLSADAMEDYRPNSTVAAIINAGGMRTDIDAGNVTLQHASECFPFGNALVELDFTGEDLWNVFEGIVSKTNTKNGRAVTSFVQVSRSIRFTYNPDNPVGSRLITLLIKDQPVVITKTYKITTLDYLASGGDNFWPAASNYAILDPMDVVWAKYVKDQSPVSYSLQGRIMATTDKKDFK